MKTVADLIDYLNKFDPADFVFLSKDEEGNDFKPWSGDISVGYSDNDGDFYYESGPGFSRSICIWP